MHSAARGVSWVLGLMRRHDAFLRPTALLLGVWGLVCWAREGLPEAYPWFGGAAALLAFLYAGRLMTHVVFLPERFPVSGATQLGSVRAVAVGDFHASGDKFHNTPVTLWDVPVEVRRIQFLRPPGVVAAVPPNHWAWPNWRSAWYPGSHIATGWVFLRGRAYPGVRMAYLGKWLLVGLESEETVAAVAGALAD